ncbi:putative clathrin-coated vesicle protein [Pilobolus umbonatus]|nr:putative clathrin-coated vesicle protein [Pilobolus umbonatus]
MTCFSEITSMNFSLYGQWMGLVSVVLLIVLGIVGFLGHVVFSIVGWVIALLVAFVEIPFCTRLCPTSPKFDSFLSYFENSWFRAIMYIVFAVVMFLSNLLGASSLIACGVTLLLSGLCYMAAAAMGQSFASSKFLGGTGVDNVV